MEDGAGAGDGKVQLQVAVVVPGEGADPVAGSYAEVLEAMCELRHTSAEVGVGIAMAAGFAPGHDLLSWE